MKSRKHSLWSAYFFLFLFSSANIFSAIPETPQKPSDLEKYLNASGVKPGMVIGEIGAGEGALTFPLAAKVGPKGKIYANDINEEWIREITIRSEEESIGNIEIVIGELEDPLFPVQDLDMIIMKDVLHDVEIPLSLLENTKKYLKPGAPLVIIDRDPRDEKSDRSFKKNNPHWYSKDTLVRIVEESSFALERYESFDADNFDNENVYIFRVDPKKETHVWSDWMDAFHRDMEIARKSEEKASNTSAAKKNVWERLFFTYRANNPDSREDEELRTFISSRIAYWMGAIKNAGSGLSAAFDPQVHKDPPRTRLRSEYASLNYADVKSVMRRLGFPQYNGRIRSGEFPNQFEKENRDGMQVILDTETALMWIPDGSSHFMNYFEAQEWLNALNARGYAGFSDWRLPTIEEAASLMTSDTSNEGLQLESLFSADQLWIWTGDRSNMSQMWIAVFDSGMIIDGSVINSCFVRAVRSMTSPPFDIEPSVIPLMDWNNPRGHSRLTPCLEPKINKWRFQVKMNFCCRQDPALSPTRRRFIPSLPKFPSPFPKSRAQDFS